MTTTTWSIDWLQASTQTINGFSEVVLSAGWRVTGTDGTNTASAYGSVSFPEPEVGGVIIAYADLTLDTVLGWAWEHGVDKPSIEESIPGQVLALSNPVSVSPPLPWVVVPAETPIVV